MNIRPLTFTEMTYPVTMSYARIAEELEHTPIIDIRNKENDMKDFIVVHRDDRVAIILKKAITAISKFEDVTHLYFDGNALFVDDKYEDVVKQYLA